MKIAIDMDNTIIDELGSTLRPGIIDFLKELSERHELILWTNSKRLRTMEILDYFAIRKYFSKIITRENYDPDEIGLRKNIEKHNVDILIDDDINEIQFVNSIGRIGINISAYRKNRKINKHELKDILNDKLDFLGACRT